MSFYILYNPLSNPIVEDNDGETYVTLQQEEFLLMNKEDQEDDDSQCKTIHILYQIFIIMLNR